MAAQPPRPSARNPGARGGAGAPSGAGAPRAGPSHASNSGASGSNAKGDKPAGTFFLGRYRVVEEIGIGGMASVHLARMDGPGGFQKWVAIKRIHPNLVEDDQFVDMFLDEARIAAGINHANVAQVFDLGKDEGTYWIAMEYLHGEPLRELMRRCEDRSQAISADIAARVCADAAEGLHAAHELRGKNNQLLGLVHRDVTPHNLFITYEGYTKVVDFGIAKVADRLSETRAGTLKGKLAYMSPEQVRGQDDVDRTTDIFALGVVLWELTTGHRLFRMDTDLDTLEKVQACVVPPPSTIVNGYPIELESVVMKALAKKKPERYQTAREFSRALLLYLQRRAVLIGPEEVSAFVRELFADRIKAREAHLAWAADVTGTINIDQLNAMKTSRNAERAGGRGGNELSVKSMSDPSTGEGPRTIAMSADNGRPSVPGSAMPPIRPNAGMGDPGAQQAREGEKRPESRRAPPPPPPPTVPNSPGARNAQQPTRAGVQSLVDDDEDIPTTVATRDQVQGLQPGDLARGPLPAAGSRAQPGRPGPGNSIRSTTLGLGGASNGEEQRAHALGSTIAMPPPPPPGGGSPTFGPPPASQPGGFQPGGGAGALHPGARTIGMSQPNHPPSQPGYFPNGYQNQGQQSSRPDLPTFGPPPSMSQSQYGQQQGGQHQHGQHPQQGQLQSSHQSGQMQQQSPHQSGQMQQVSPHQSGHMQQQQMPPPQHGQYQHHQQQQQQHQQQQQQHQQQQQQQRPFQQGRPPPSTVETALSLPRPDPSAMWLANQTALKRSGDSMSTVVLIAVAVLTAICVLALGALIYFRYRAAPSAPSGALQHQVMPLEEQLGPAADPPARG